MRRPDVDLAVTTERGLTLLHVATTNAYFTHLLLARRVVDVNAITMGVETALHIAGLMGKDKVVSMLLEQPEINVNIALERTGTPLHFALARWNEDIALRLIAFPGTDINWRSHICARPINLVITCNLMKSVRALCAKSELRMTGEMKAGNMWPPLVVAAHGGNAEILKVLLACLTKRKHENACGKKTAHAVAVNHGFTECARMLTDKEKKAINLVPCMLVFVIVCVVQIVLVCRRGLQTITRTKITQVFTNHSHVQGGGIALMNLIVRPLHTS
jgi:hypothetical protein